MTKIFLIRHGETIWNCERRFQGFADIELTPLGIRQAELLGKRLSENQLTAVYSSPLKRALKTAQIIADYHRFDVTTDDRLREFNQGELEGIQFSEADHKFKEFFAAWRKDPAGSRPPGGESFRELQDRGWQFLRAAIEKHVNETIVVVAHGMINRTIVARILNLELKHYGKLGQDLAALNLIESDSKWDLTLRKLNDTHHLNGLDI